MDFWESDELGDHRDAARVWAGANVGSEWAEEQERTGCHQTLEVHARLASDGILAAGWPAEYGGSGVDPNFARAVFDECSRRGLRADGWATTAMVLHTIEHVGTEEQKRRFIGGALRGEMLIALGYSEPDCGSDVAAAKTTAARDGAEWVINGQKMFTSTAQVCSHVFLLTRTNPAVPKHQGLTLFLVPTECPGYDRQPIYTLGGQVTNATYYTDVRVDDSDRIGGVDDGWSVMNVALVYERGVAGQTSLEQTLARDLAEWARQARRVDATSVWQDPLVAERIGRMAVEEEVTKLLGQWVQWGVDQGNLPGVEGSMRKLFYTEADQRRYSDALDILGVAGVLAPGAFGAPGGGRFELDFRNAVVTTVYAGTSEILRDIIAQRGLGLPRTRRTGGNT
jgi:alkylation response protein AidB-like acyl-CoA dehydrogenase